MQEEEIEYFNLRGNLHFTDDGRRAEIPIDLVLQSRAEMSDNEVNGPEDAVVSEMIKQLLQEKMYIITKCFQERFMGLTDARSSWKIVKIGVSTKTRRGTKERNQEPQGHGTDIEMVRGVCYPSLGKEDRT